MSQFHNSKLSSQTRTLSKRTYPVDLHYRRLLSAGIAWASSLASRTAGSQGSCSSRRSQSSFVPVN